MSTAWATGREWPEDQLRVISEGVMAHGRSLAADGGAAPLACLLREGDTVLAGAVGRTEYGRLFVNWLWVAPARRGQGLGSEALARLEAAAAAAGCADVLIETLNDRAAALYQRLGYRPLARIEAYVGPFDRHVLHKLLAGP